MNAVAGSPWTNHSFVLAAVAKYGSALQYASAELRANKEVVMAAVAQDHYALQWASAELQADRGVVMVALAQNGLALQLASDETKADREVVMAAVAENGDALLEASDELQEDLFFVWFQARTRSKKLWTVLSVRFYVVLFVKKLQRRVEERDRERFEVAWAEHRDELTVGVPECVGRAVFQHGWAAGRKRMRVE
jgi:hypothetical protein